jgi:hypothetical protein
MPKTQFLGRVIPPCLACTLSGIPEVNWLDSERGTKATFSITIENSHVTVSVCFLDGEEPPFIFAYIKALDLAKAAVDTTAFMTGHGLTVILENWVDSKGVTAEILLTDPQLSSLATVFTRPNGLNEVIQLVMTDPPLFHALNDLILSITVPHHSATNCARVAESIRHMIAGQGAPPKAAWPVMRQTLNVDENYLTLITGISLGPRHGHRVRVDGTATTEVVKRTWVIMNRFLEYRIRGNKQLDPVDFPLLKG